MPEYIKGEFVPGSTFTGIWYPLFASKPDGPQTQSMARCQCGALWNRHRVGDGACPVAGVDPGPRVFLK